ncbi:hypothetical protein RXV94_08185 [Yeosuana sp. MJ-SS3]|uniref:Lipocalin-like domain-containing protein n=1 Tax=Gilvirhabdus luticola TaxID=3079858 RepID=A0ABU3U6V5_9FLAO|nr:hypothetical protein [Yeosuana sp. MJ-SS3]MDU8886134.1 hypothetical protein [Yeosuana sp. MJ-SS3]
MKKLLLILVTCALCLSSSCNNDNANTKTETWFLVNISGGIAGINENFEKGIIAWTFNEEGSALTVENTTGSTNGFESGTHSYRILRTNGKKYLIVENNEIGGMIETENQLTIDQNMQSGGSGADGFILLFEK